MKPMKTSAKLGTGASVISAAEPGAILANDEDLAFFRRLPALTEVKIAGRHYVQEDSSDEIGRAIARWMRKLG
jgi:haloalkane dehalogenase